MKRLFTILVGLVSILLVGCGLTSRDYNSASSIMSSALHDKYDHDFVVTNIREENISDDLLVHMYLVGDTEYDDTEFEVMMDSNTKTISDTLPAVIFQGRVLEDMQNVISKVDNVEILDLSMKSTAEVGNWITDEDYPYYLRNCNSYVKASVGCTADTLDEAVQVCSKLQRDIIMETIPCILNFEYRGKSCCLTLNNSANAVEKTDREIKNELR